MISYSAALRIIADTVRPSAPRRTALGEAAGLTLADGVTAAVAVPPFANAAMDGFALRSADTAQATPEAPVAFALAGSVAAGQPAPQLTPPGGAWEIMTGAPLPADCDTVVPVERTERVTATRGRERVLIRQAAQPGENRRGSGEDFAAGQPVLGVGSALTPHAVMGLAAAGCDAVLARTAPRVAVITTGSELRDSGVPSGPGEIRDTNGPYLTAVFRHLRLPLSSLSSVGDEPDPLVEHIRHAASRADVVVTTGGVSAGRLDLVPEAVTRLAGEILFHKVAIRPGKPLLFARLPGGVWFFGLPGNPMAVAVGLRFFVIHALRALQGLTPEEFPPARSLSAVHKRENLTFFAKAVADIDANAQATVRLLPGQESFRIAPLLQANCWAVVPDGRDSVAAGELIRIAPLYPTEFLQPVA